MKKMILLAAVILLTFPLNQLNAIEKYILIDLGTMGYDSSYATSINNHGVVAGVVTSESEFWYSSGARWDNNQGVLLKFHEELPGDVSWTNDINDRNEIVGAVSLDGDRPSGCLWSADGDLQNVYGTGSAIDVNQHSQLIGHEPYEDHTFFCEDRDCKLIINGSESGFYSTSPAAINDVGKVVGTITYYENYGDGSGEYWSNAFFWENDELYDLNNLVENDYDGILKRAADINNLGIIIGSAVTNDGASSSYMFDPEGIVIDLGFSGARAINNLDQVIGNNHLYENQQLFYIPDLIESDIEFADLKIVDINDVSQIAGSAEIDGVQHAIRLDPCEPTYYYRDSDGDGYGNLDDELNLCLQPEGYVTEFSDCDDGENAVNPDADEICNGKDDNCDGQVDEGVTQTFFEDSDGDGYGNVSMPVQACVLPAGHVSDNTDCDDSTSTVFPGVAEIKNGIDDNCDGEVDEGFERPYFKDLDGDGYGDNKSQTVATDPPPGFVSNNTDCNDGDADIHPNASEACNEIDDDCNGTIDEGVEQNYFRDEDGDGFGHSSDTISSCTLPDGYAADSTDCDDKNASIFPDASEISNNIDDNCDGQIDEGLSDAPINPSDNAGPGDGGGSSSGCFIYAISIVDD